MTEYLHGYTQQEYDRLIHQAEFLEEKVYDKISFPEHGLLIEYGCGVGAQSQILLRRYPHIKIIAIDRSEDAIQIARAQNTSDRIEFVCSDLKDFKPPQKADAAFFCWMLEHVPNPEELLFLAKENLKTNAPIHVIEVQNNSLYVSPYSEILYTYWDAFNRLQIELRGDPFVGVKLPYYLKNAGFRDVVAQPRMFIYDKSDEEELNSIANYWWRLMDSASEQLLNRKIISAYDYEAVKSHLLNLSAHQTAFFSYTFIHASAIA